MCASLGEQMYAFGCVHASVVETAKWLSTAVGPIRAPLAPCSAEMFPLGILVARAGVENTLCGFEELKQFLIVLKYISYKICFLDRF